jgi:PRTRC genetic system protein C
MAIQEKNLRRVFVYNGMRLGDLAPSKSPQEVMAMYAGSYPELNNAVVEGPTTSGGEMTYKFARSAGAKGNGSQRLHEIIQLIASEDRKSNDPRINQSDKALGENAKWASTVLSICSARPSGPVLQPSSAAFSHYG